jgi:hypothetical protein
MAEVAATKTPVDEVQGSIYLVVALTTALQSVLSEQIAVYSMALAWIETGNGQLIQNNPGNITKTSNWTGNYWRPPWYPDDHDPKYDALHAAMLAGKAPSAFRAYPDQQSGWNDYAREIVRRKKLLAAMNADDPAAVVAALHDSYSSDYGEKHVETFRKLVAGFRSRNLFGGLPRATTSVATTKRTTGVGIGTILVLVAGAGAALVVALLSKKRGRK